MSSGQPEYIQSLVSMGFSQLESQIYGFLLRESPASGYRIAKAVGKPVANTYKAIETLYSKGAVMLEEGSIRLYRPVLPVELVGQIERSFQKRGQQALELLKKITELAPDADTRLYKLHSRAQVLERSRNMLQRCRTMALLDVFPDPLEEIRPDLEKAVSRGVHVAIKAYRDFKIPGTQLAVAPDGEEILRRWEGHWLNIIIDAKEMLLVFLRPDEQVSQAIWSESSYISWLYHNGLYSELVLTDLEKQIKEGVEAKELQKSLRGYKKFSPPLTPVYDELRNALGKSKKKGRKSNQETLE